MKPSTVEAWAWVLIYGGLLLLCVSLFVNSGDAALVLGLRGTGGVAALAGVLLIYLRSRMRP